MIFGK